MKPHQPTNQPTNLSHNPISYRALTNTNAALAVPAARELVIRVAWPERFHVREVRKVLGK